MTALRQCTRCVMDESATGIVFDGQGQCNYCTEFADVLAAQPPVAERDSLRAALIDRIKRSGKGKRYDCIVGVSGGADSSYSLYLAVREGLRPLAVHLDNGWNSELASHNIATLIDRLKVDLMTHVIDWEENRDLQRSFFAAGVIDIELLMDTAMLAANFSAALEPFEVRCAQRPRHPAPPRPSADPQPPALFDHRLPARSLPPQGPVGPLSRSFRLRQG
jgi:hypothetical protein